jgi:hypothetical protein
LVRLDIGDGSDSEGIEFFCGLGYGHCLPSIGGELISQPLDLALIIDDDQCFARSEPGAFSTGQDISCPPVRL